MQKLLGFYSRQLSTYSRCQTLYRSLCSEKKINCCKSRGHVPQCPIAGDANVSRGMSTVCRCSNSATEVDLGAFC